MKSFLQVVCVVMTIVWLPATVMATGTPNSTNKETVYTYPSRQPEGLIGTTELTPVDNPADNIFHVEIKKPLSRKDRAWLVYELDGVMDHTSVPRSINDQLAVGGYLVKKRKGWSTQREEISAEWLRQGDNVIRFTTALNSPYSYRVKNLRLEISAGNAAAEQIHVIVNQPSGHYYFDKGYVKGLVIGGRSQSTRVNVAGKPARIYNGEFESIIDVTDLQNSCTAEIEIVHSDGTTTCSSVTFSEPLTPDFVNRLDDITHQSEELFQKGQAGRIELRGASVSITVKALQGASHISLTTLRDVDIPALDGGMVNVTRYHDGFRFLPHGTVFLDPVRLTLPYDETKIPEGYTANDIKTFYFDEESHHWVPLKVDTVLTNQGEVISSTLHFTDMINGILRVPEAPEVEAFSPTRMKGIKMADPGAEITLMNPPQSTHAGTANLAYPIKIPEGRAGIQPDLSIGYTSGGGNGWLGLGWNLAIPMISIETRWGVPRYDQAKESETYTLNGEMLSPVAHRSEPVDRTSGDKQFYPRVEGPFNRIIRHGSNPTNYWWEMTDKNGTRFFYGGGPAGMDKTALLRDNEQGDAGNIAQWLLSEIRDVNGNTARYHYVQVEDKGVPNGNVNGYQIYIDKITYTGFSGSEGKYAVKFIRDRQLGEARRKDIGIAGNLGFKQVTADLLRKIEVQFEGKNIRHYELTYKTGEFYKTLLQSISEFDAEGKHFNTHEFSYYNDVRNGNSLRPFNNAEGWTIPSDGIEGGLIVSKAGFDDNASVLSGNKSTDFGFGMTVTVGLNDGELTNKSNTLGGSFGYSESETEGRIYLIDINGDGLVDKVMADENGFRYRANLSRQGTPQYSNEVYEIRNASTFLKDKSKTVNGGFEAQGGIGSAFTAFVGVGASETTTVTSVYFTDVNGDQLPDLIDNGTAYFNHLDPVTGVVTFLPTSDLTPSPIAGGGSVALGIFEVDPQELEEAIDANPLHDLVRMWRAPFDGVIAIQAPVNLVNTGTQRLNADGVKVSIQKNGNPPMWMQTIAANDFAEYHPSSVSNIPVSKGDRIYFRVQSIFNGESDLVQWSPIIGYVGQNHLIADANAHKIYRFDAAKEFVLTAPMQIAAPIPGRVKIESVFEKPRTTDDVRVEVIKQSGGVQSIIYSNQFAWNQTVSEAIDLDVVVAANESFAFKVSSATNVNWPQLKWRPHLYYTESFDPTITDLFRNGEPVISYYGVPEYSLFANAVHVTMPWVVTENVNEITVEPEVGFPALSSPFFNGQLTFSVKKRNTLLLRESLAIQLGQISSPASFDVDVVVGDTLYFEFHSRDELLAEAITQREVTITQGLDESTADAGVYTVYAHEEDFIFGPLYRQWGHFACNGNRGRATNPINEADLKLSDRLKHTYNSGDVQDPDDLSSSDPYDPSADNFIMLFAKGKELTWSAYDPFTWLDGNRMSSSRMGDDDLTPISAIPGGGSGTVRAVHKISKNTTLSASTGGGGAIANGSANASTGSSRVLSDLIDMNGDRYPDIITEKGVQYTKPTGALREGFENFSTGNISETSTHAFGASAGGFVKIIPKGGTTDEQDVNSDVGEAKVSGVISVNYGQGTNTGDYSWQDINGDGLPDRVYKNGDVQLNLGYKLAAPESWSQSGLQVSESQSIGGGLGFNVGVGSESSSIAGGIGLSRSDNDVSRALQDINGDGLADEVTLTSGVKVKLNTGNGFSSSALTDWSGADKINESSTTGESANAAFTGCIPLPPIAPVIKLCFNPSGSAGQSISRDEAQMSDVNGDGFADYVTSLNDGDLNVKASSIGRTNLLKVVKRPLGATFTLNYSRVGNTYEMPNDVWTLESLKVFDGFKGDGPDTMMTTFTYENGRYDRHEREFYGFKKVIIRTHDTGTENNPVYTTAIHTYLNDNFYEKGLLVNELLIDGAGNMFVEKDKKYELKNIHSGATHPDEIRSDPAGTAFPALMKTTETFYEGQPAGKSIIKTYAYDALGNVTQYTDSGDEGDEDDLMAVIAYHNLPDLYIVGTPQSITVSGSGIIYRKRESEIDAASGDIKAIKQFVSDTEIARYDLEYDQFGNLKKITRPVNHKGQRLSYEYEYDPQVQTYPSRVSNSYGYTSEVTYDVRFGEPLVKTDLNGNEIIYELDAAGRVKNITGPYETNRPDKTIEFEYHPEATVPWALTSHVDPQNKTNKIQSSAFVDGLGRTIQTKKDWALFEGDGKADKEVMIVSGRIMFDAFGRSVKGYFPITEELNNQGVFNPSFDDVAPTQTTYDVLDRVVSLTLPDGSVTKTDYSFGSDRDSKQQFLKKTTDPNGKVIEEFTDVRTRITAVKNSHAGEPVWTSFRYNAINEQIEATDDLGNTIVLSYDNLGRRISRQHPDAGTTLYTYDLAGNLRELITANLGKEGKAIIHNYDFERPTEIIYPDNTENNVKYTYGAAGEGDNRAGRVVLQEDASGAQEFFYGPLGEVVKNVRTIVLPKFGDDTYVTEWTYDTWNRITSMVYADGEEVSYAYNAGGSLHSMSGKKKNATYRYVNHVGYDKFEQRVFMSYGNGTKMTYAYEPDRRRLKDMKAETSARRVFMNNHYTFDNATNILSLVNDAPIPAPNLMGGSSEYNYEYDDLYRLKSSTGLYKSKNDEHTYAMQMAYNSVGSIIQKTQTHIRKNTIQKKTSYDYTYTYGTDQPHAPVHIGGMLEGESGRGEGKTYQYDANGNQIAWEDDPSGQRRKIMWDEENRIRSVYDNGAQHHYAYDATGERVWKAKSVGQRIFVNGEWKAGSGQMGNYTVYVSPYLVLTSGGYTKHYYIEGQRILSKLGGGWDNHGKGPLKAGGNSVDFATKAQQVFDGIVKNLKFLGDDGQILTAGKSGKTPPGQINGTGNVTEAFRYFFHPDHLGSTRFVTDAAGEVYQHLEYFAFGDIMVHEHSNTHRTPYLFNGKELDEETGLYYYGARYYDPKISMWQSVDPMAEDLPGLSPYNYSLNNPVVHNDPEGKIPPLIIAWAVVEIGLAVYDAYETYQTLKSSDATGAEKTVAVLGTVGGAFLPGGGYGTVGKKVTKEVVENVTQKAVKETIEKGAKESAEKGFKESSKKSSKHHIATNKNNVSTARGGPWTPRYKKFFEGAGLDINKAPENLVEVIGHHGPHPEAYHKYVFDNLASATKGLKPGTKAYKDAVVNTLNKIAKQAKTKGSKVNKLLTE